MNRIPKGFEPLDNIGDLIEISEFLASVKNKFFTDYDGHGYWATKDYAQKISNPNDWIKPSRINSDQKPPSWATHIMWYNR